MINKYLEVTAVCSTSDFIHFLSIPTHFIWYSNFQDFNHFVPVKIFLPIVNWLTNGQVKIWLIPSAFRLSHAKDNIIPYFAGYNATKSDLRTPQATLILQRPTMRHCITPPHNAPSLTVLLQKRLTESNTHQNNEYHRLRGPTSQFLESSHNLYSPV